MLCSTYSCYRPFIQIAYVVILLSCMKHTWEWGRGTDVFEIKACIQIPFLIWWFCCSGGRMCYEMHKRNSIWAPSLLSLPSSPVCYESTRPPYSAGLAPRAFAPGCLFLVLSVCDWMWIDELAAILYGVTIKLFLTLFCGQTMGWVRRKCRVLLLLLTIRTLLWQDTANCN